MTTPPFKIGDLVTSAYPSAEHKLVRRVTDVSLGSQSSWLVSADNGGHCACCGRPFGTRIFFALASQFNLTSGNPDNTDLVKREAEQKFNLGMFE